MQRPIEMRGVFYELASKIRDGKVEQPLFHTVAQCLYLKREMIEELMKDPAAILLVRNQCESFLGWIGKQPHFPFGSVQSEDSLQEKVRVLSLLDQLLLFDALVGLWDSIRAGDKSGLTDILQVIGSLENE